MALSVRRKKAGAPALRRPLMLPAIGLVASGLLLGCAERPIPGQEGIAGVAPGTTNGAAPPAAPEAPTTESVTEPTVQPQASEPLPPAPPVDASQPGPPGSGIATGEPYVVIRFPDSSVDYEAELAEAVRRAKERRPNLAFDLVALTPPARSAEELEEDVEEAESRAAAIVESLSAMGIAADRVHIVTWTGQATEVDEIRLYIR